MKILVATDGSDGAKFAVLEAIQLAEELDAELEVISVWHLPAPVAGIPPYYYADPQGDQVARESVDSAVAEASVAGVVAHGDVLGPSFDSGREIVEAAKRTKCDLVVVGSRGRGAFAGAILGSVSRFVVTHADCPVLVAKHRAAVAA